MASTKSPEAEKWKAKYYGLLDRFDKQESDWVKSEKMLSLALSRVSLIAEGESPQIDSHLQALRVVLKEKFDLYRLESVLSELLKLIKESEKKSKNKKNLKIDLADVVDMLDGIKLPKEFSKKKNLLVKELKNNPTAIKEVSVELQSLFKELNDSQPGTEEGGFISRLLSNKGKADSGDTLALLSAAITSIPWTTALEENSKKLVASLQKCNDNK
ncbi:MAG: hypothetical protein KAQ67_06165, partial [Gammaproteobacteria bacterium]|nr:hypothetical protein [Gammaproteobacteria bacterium]